MKNEFVKAFMSGVKSGREFTHEMDESGFTDVVIEITDFILCCAVMKSNLSVVAKLCLTARLFNRIRTSDQKLNKLHKNERKDIDSPEVKGFTAMSKIGFQY